MRSLPKIDNRVGRVFLNTTKSFIKCTDSSLESLHSHPLNNKMVRVNTTSDLESTIHDRPPNELDSLIQHSEYKPSKKQARLAFFQFLTFCWALFMIGWTDGTTGPLIPTITKFYDVSCPIATPSQLYTYDSLGVDRLRNSVLCICFQLFGQSCLFSRDITTSLLHLSGNGCGSLAEYAFGR